MIQPETWKMIGDYASKSWAAVGPLIGVLVGAYLTGRQKRDWLADNKKEEYRELLSAMKKRSASIFSCTYWGLGSIAMTNVTSELMEVTRSRL
jgi:hypothetical protein